MEQVCKLMKRERVAKFLNIDNIPYLIDITKIGKWQRDTVNMEDATVEDLAFGLIAIKNKIKKWHTWIDDWTRNQTMWDDDKSVRMAYLRARDEVDAILRTLHHDLKCIELMHSAALRAGAREADNALDILFKAANTQ